MENWISQLSITIAMLKSNLSLVCLILAGLWGIQIINWLCHYRLNILGIYPRRIPGLLGILFFRFDIAD